MKNYGIVSGLTKNPKTPLALSLTLMSRLTAATCRCYRSTGTSRSSFASLRAERVADVEYLDTVLIA